MEDPCFRLPVNTPPVSLQLGLERYHGVAILGFNSPEWFISDVGCTFAG